MVENSETHNITLFIFILSILCIVGMIIAGLIIGFLPPKKDKIPLKELELDLDELTDSE